MAVQALTAIGFSLITFGVLVGLGVLVLQRFGDVAVVCANIGGGAATWNTATQLCQNASGSTAAGAGSAFTTISYVGTQLGSTGLAGWIPLIIVVVIAGLIFSYFGMKGKSY